MRPAGAIGGRALRRAAGPLASAGLAACSGPQHVLAPRGPAAERLAELWWVMFGLAAVVCVAVVVLLVMGILRARRRHGGIEAGEIDGRKLVLAGGVILPAIILFSVLLYTFRVGTRVYPPVDPEEDLLTIEVTGHQFWWEVRYPEHGIVTANEIHIPVGRRVRLLLRSPDVIHSFWVPQLHGKIDMIPGRINTLVVEAGQAGAFRGQCAEFCGAAHALMALWVIATPDEEFAAWIAQRRAPDPEPESAAVRRGREVFFAAGCGECHATRGVPLPPSVGEVGPDLSDLATRRTLAAGTLPNTRGALGGWIADPQRIKPGSLMPGTRLPAEELQALLTYLQSLR